jgi:hypothetical protein
MTTPLNYTVIPGDQNHLEYIVNSLTSHDLGQVLNTLSTPTFAGGNITGSLTVGADLDVTNDVTIGNDLDVTGAISADSIVLEGLDQNSIIFLNTSDELDTDTSLIWTTNLLTVNGTIYSSGTTGDTPVSGAGTRLMWIPSKSAFRAGAIDSTQWDAANIGNYSGAFGANTKASGSSSFACGIASEATGNYSIALGNQCVASGSDCVAIGYKSAASHTASTALGYSCEANESYSIAFGRETYTEGVSSTAFGESTSATGSISLATGYSTNATNTSSFSGGYNINNDATSLLSSGLCSFAFGYATSGNELKATGQASVAMGEDVNSTNDNALSFGKDFTNSTASSFAVGFGAIDLLITSGLADFQDTNITTTGLGTFGQLTTDYLDMPEIAAPSTPSTNNLRIYTEAIKGFSFLKYLDDTGMKRAFMRDSVIPVKNVRGTAIAASRIVYATGSEDNVPTVDTAKADSLTTMPAIGVTIESIADGAYGRVMQVGLLENINTSAFSEGDVLYVSDSTAGVPTATKPVTPSISQEIGTVLVSDVSVGAIQIVARGITGSEYGTIQNTFSIGDGSAGSKTLTFNSATDGSIIWDETKFDFGSNNITTTGLGTFGNRNSTTYKFVVTESGVNAEDGAVLTTDALKGRAVALFGNGGSYYLGRDVTNDIEFIMGTSSEGAAFIGAMTNHNLHIRSNNSNVAIARTDGDLEAVNDILFTGGTSNVRLTTRNANFVIQSDVSGIDTNLEVFSKDGDGTDAVNVQFWGKGTPASIANRERLILGYVPTPSIYYGIRTDSAGTGTLRPIQIYTGSNTTQSVYNIDGTVNFANGIRIGDTTALANETLEVYGHSSVLNGNEQRFYDTGSSNYVGFEAPALTANQIWVLPSADGTNGQILSTNGAGTLSWTDNTGDSTFTSRFYATLSANQDIASGSFATVICDSESFDGDSEYNTGTGLFTAGANGYYIFTCCAGLGEAVNDGDVLIIALDKNAGTYVAQSRCMASAGSYLNATCSVVVYMAANDTMSVQVYHNYGANRELSSTAGWTQFSGHRIS